MHRELAPDQAARALNGGTPGCVGQFAYDVLEDRWWWSPEIYAMHGFEQGEVVPTSSLLLSHKHLDHPDEAAVVLKRAFTDGGSFSAHHRIVDTRRKVRDVLVVGDGPLTVHSQNTNTKLREVARRLVASVEAGQLAAPTEVRRRVEWVLSRPA